MTEMILLLLFDVLLQYVVVTVCLKAGLETSAWTYVSELSALCCLFIWDWCLTCTQLHSPLTLTILLYLLSEAGVDGWLLKVDEWIALCCPVHSPGDLGQHCVLVSFPHHLSTLLADHQPCTWDGWNGMMTASCVSL